MAVVGWLPDSLPHLIEKKIEEACALLEASTKRSRGGFEARVVGPAALLNTWIPLLDRHEFKLFRNLRIESDTAAVFYYCESNKLRVDSNALTHSFPAATQTKKTRVLIVDDSKTMITVLRKIFEADATIEVVGAAERPSLVDEMITRLKPDVMTLDIHMPEMNGVELLEKILPKHRVPAVLVTSISRQDGDYVLRALELGAVDYIQKPSLAEIDEVGKAIIEKVKVASQVRVGSVRFDGAQVLGTRPFSGTALRTDRVIAIGSSTGGTEALRVLLEGLPEKIPPIVIVQHIPPVFSAALAARLNELFPFEVKEAEDGDELSCDRVLIAPGGKQMEVIGRGTSHTIRITDAPPVNRHKPSVDVLFNSVVKSHGAKAVAAILTGMGADGAKGLLALRTAGAYTLAQDEASCVVFGMPRAAIQLNAADKVVNLHKMAQALVESFESPKDKKAA